MIMNPRYFYVQNFKPLCAPLRTEDHLDVVHFGGASICVLSGDEINLSPPQNGFIERDLWVLENNPTIRDGLYTVDQNGYLLRIKGR